MLCETFSDSDIHPVHFDSWFYLVQGKNEMEQLDLIFKLCGTPTSTEWPDVDKLPWCDMNTGPHVHVTFRFNASCPMTRPGPNRFCRGSHIPVGCRKSFGGPRRYVVCSRFSSFHAVSQSSELFCIVNTQSARSLIDKFLTLDPNQRISAKDALDSDYFWEDPLPCKPSELPKYEPSHEFQTRKRRQVRESWTRTHFSRILSRVIL